MCDILDELFSCSPHFEQGREFETQYAAALDNVLRAEEVVKTRLLPEHWLLVNNYLEQIQDLHTLDCRFQFERGFLIKAQLSAEVLLRYHKLS